MKITENGLTSLNFREAATLASKHRDQPAFFHVEPPFVIDNPFVKTA